jgi:hypothetical protein
MLVLTILFGGALASAVGVFLGAHVLVAPAVLLALGGYVFYMEDNIDSDTPPGDYIPILVGLGLLGLFAPALLLFAYYQVNHQGAGILGVGWLVLDVFLVGQTLRHFLVTIPGAQRSRHGRRRPKLG